MNWEYISGFFDADGSISAISTHKNRNRTIQLSFHNTEKSILEDIQRFILKDIGYNISNISQQLVDIIIPIETEKV